MPFSGKATYDNFSMIGEDISDILLMIAPTQTPLLDILAPADKPATNIYHQWSEEALGPDRLVCSTAVNSATAATGVQLAANGNLLTVGMLLELESPSGNQEVVQVSSVVGANSVLLTRNFGSRGVNSLAAGGTLFVISTAELEGSDTSGDLTRARTRRDNYTQIFKKPVTISGSDQAVITAPSVGSEFDHQVTLRTIELAKELEKAVVRGVRSGSSIGSATAYRTMDGIRQFITSVNSQISSSSFAANPVDYVNDLMQQVWNTGARDVNLLIAGPQWKRELSASNTAKLQISQDENKVVRYIETIQTDFGVMQIMLTPWLPDRHIMGLATSRIKVTPLQSRSFQRMDLALTGDNRKGHVLGEYTLEVHHPDKMFQARTAG